MKREKHGESSEPVRCRVCGIPHTKYGGIFEKDNKFICWRCNKKERKRKRSITPISMSVVTKRIEKKLNTEEMFVIAYEEFLKRDDIGYPDEFTMEQVFRAGWDASCEVHRNG